jgi:hypothetical protein
MVPWIGGFFLYIFLSFLYESGNFLTKSFWNMWFNRLNFFILCSRFASTSFFTKKVPKKTTKQVRRASFKSHLCPKSKIISVNTYTSSVDMLLCHFIKSFPNFETVFDKISRTKNYMKKKIFIKIFQMLSDVNTSVVRDDWNKQPLKILVKQPLSMFIFFGAASDYVWMLNNLFDIFSSQKQKNKKELSS